MMSFLEKEGLEVSVFAGVSEPPNGNATTREFDRMNGLLMASSNNARLADSEG